MKYLIIGLNFLVENPQAPLEKTIREIAAQPPHPPPKNKKAPAPPFLRMLQNFQPPTPPPTPLQKGGRTL